MEGTSEIRFFANLSPSTIAHRTRLGRPLVLPLHVVAKDHPFPHPDWDDFVLPILSGWLERVRGLLTGENKVALLRFMDGPYSIRLTVKDGQTVEFATLINEREVDGKTVKGNVLLSDFARQLLEAAGNLMGTLEKSGVQDDDTTALRDEMGRSQQVMEMSPRRH
jgi:hypothetical protein